MNLSSKEVTVLKALAVFGFLIPNGLFLYYALWRTSVFITALKNPVPLVSIAEAFLLMILFAWLLRRAGVRKLRPPGLIVMSLVGRMACSVPATMARIATRPSPRE